MQYFPNKQKIQNYEKDVATNYVDSLAPKTSLSVNTDMNNFNLVLKVQIWKANIRRRKNTIWTNWQPTQSFIIAVAK